MRILHDHARVRVPATSGNCGPGFDSIGMAHDIWDDVSARLTTGPSRVTILGEGAKDLPTDESHLIVRVMRETMDRFGLPQAGIELVCRNSIQQGKGLGSSAAAIVAGLMLVAGLTGSLSSESSGGSRVSGDSDGSPSPFNKDAMLDIAMEYEGHPDNAAPCLYGGATLSWQSHTTDAESANQGTHTDMYGPENAGTAVRTVKLNVHPNVQTSLLIPADILPTKQARAVLPQMIPHKDGTLQAAHSALFVYALEHDPDLLYDATEDHLHQSYRAESMPRTAALLEALRDAGWPAVISGAGPAILLFAPVDTALAQVVTAQGFQVVDSRQVGGAELVY